MIILLLSAVLFFVHQLHMFQLNGYDFDEHKHYLAKFDFLNILFFLQSVFCGFAVYFTEKDDTLSFTFLGVSALCFLFSLKFYFKKTKKPLVFTHRALRLTFTSLVLISGLFILLLYLHSINELYAACVIIFPLWTIFVVVIANVINKPMEKYIQNGYIKDAKRIINSRRDDLIVIGITGSYGKTSTKFYLKDLLSEKFSVYATPKSFNTTMGVVKVIRTELSASHQIFICETGAKKVGEIKEICDIVHPAHGIITSIGPQHLETFASIDNIIKTKFELADSVNSEGDGFVILNFDNEYIKTGAGKYKNISSYSNEENNGDYKYKIIKVNSTGTQFNITCPNGDSCDFETSLLGSHTVQNLAGSIALAHKLGVELLSMRLPVRRLKPTEHRLQLINGGDCIIIDDAFNSNPVGAKAALDVLALFTDYVRIIVTPGMVELGDDEELYNSKFGEQIADVVDFAVLIGKSFSGYIKKGLLKKGFPEEKILEFEKVTEAVAYIRKSVSGLKVILLENDLPDNFK